MRPTLRMAVTTSSKGMTLSIPAMTISLHSTALAAPMALRLMQGHSTSPATGSHTSPITFFISFAAACRHISGVPPRSSVNALAAMAAADPVSA